jgi:FkbM family methyltransferase
MLIFDLGAHTGEDTQAYLSQGYNVVAVEANPRLADALALRFEREIREGQVTVIGAAIAETIVPRAFFVSENPLWSSLDPIWAGRDGRKTEAVEVPGITLADLFDRHGVPGYLKIDIEGADRIVLEQLLVDTRRPLYVSVEDCRFGPSYLGLLATCGYTGFKLSEQSQWAPGTSGPFGDDLPGEWLSYREMKALYHETVRDLAGMRIAPAGVWFDIHCRMPL